jgi:hypothetical protein
MKRAIILVLCWSATLFRSVAADEAQLWVYAPINFQVNEATDKLIALLKRAKAAGYNGAVITDYKFGRIKGRPQHYYDNMQRTREAAEEIGIELIPCVMPVGYSGTILQNNPNLAAALPVKDCEFIVRDGQATVASAENLLAGGGFEKAEKNRPAGWDWVDGFQQSTSLDADEKHGGLSSLAMRDFKEGNEHGNCRFTKKLKLKPWHEYQLSLWVKTDGLENANEFKVAPLTFSGKALNHANLGVQETQDWTQHTVVFNSLDNEEVTFYIGLWGGNAGTAWVDDVELHEVGGVNLLRRESCPLRVASADGKTVYVEGRDFEPWADEKLGVEPYAGEFSDDHAAPPIVLTKNSRIKNGDRLHVSFYHTALVYDGQVGCSLANEELYSLMQTQIEQIEKYFAPKRYFMQHDEIRVGGYDTDELKFKSMGDALAANAKRCTEIIAKVSPDAEVLVWSDMFDPHHNAVDDYYLVRGSLKNAWTGLDPKVAIVNWNGGHAAESLKFFADRGHQQIIAGYYDGDVGKNVSAWRAAAKNFDGVAGWMYTTWNGNYDELETFAKLVRD